LAVTTVRVRVGDHWYTVQVGDLSHSPVEVTVEGESYQVEVEDLPAQPHARSSRGRPLSLDIAAPPPQSRPGVPNPLDKILRTPMPGRVISILVQPGDHVSAGDEVCVVEAMKMEQSIRVPWSGVVKAVHVQPLDSVSANDPLIELE